MSKLVEQNRDSSSDREAYTRPVLREFGPVGQLTQGGTGMANEGSMTNDTMRRP